MATAKAGAAKPAKAKTGGKKTAGAAAGAPADNGQPKRRPGRPPKAAALNGANPAPTNGHNGDRESAAAIQANFLQHRTAWNRAQAKFKVAEKELKDMVAAAKADGFLKKEFEIADALCASPKKEAKIVGEVTTRLRVARWIGHAMGKQMDLFENPPITVQRSTDEAYEDGKRACMANEPKAPPPHFQVQELSQSWLAGYDAEVERRVRTGIKPLDTATVVKLGDHAGAGGAAESPWVGGDAGTGGGFGPSKLPAAAQSGADF